MNGANALKVGEPLTVKGLVRAVSALGISAGFENLSIYDFRRGGAEEVSVRLFPCHFIAHASARYVQCSVTRSLHWLWAIIIGSWGQC